MNTLPFQFSGADLMALGSGALWWQAQGLLCVSDLHLGKSARAARTGGMELPPYEVIDTLHRLDRDLQVTGARRVICLGDSFDDAGAADRLTEEASLQITRLQAGREWVWIEGNHDPGPVNLGGSHKRTLTIGPLTFRHICEGEKGEVSGHYPPKAQIRTRSRNLSRPCFLIDDHRLIMPAYGTYTGGLRCDRAPLATLMSANAQAILTGPRPTRIPMPR